MGQVGGRDTPFDVGSGEKLRKDVEAFREGFGKPAGGYPLLLRNSPMGEQPSAGAGQKAVHFPASAVCRRATQTMSLHHRSPHARERAVDASAVSHPLMMRFLLLLCLALGLLAAAPALRAATVIPPEFSELSARPDYIVRARVVHVEPELRLTQGRELIFTRITLEVLEVIAGQPPQPLVLTMLGGRIDDAELTVHGVPTFSVGDEDILFIKDNGKNFHPLYGVMHGRYPVKRDKLTGREYITRSNGVPMADVAEVSLPMSDGSAAALQRQRRSPADALTPAQFASQVRQTRQAAEGRQHAK